MKLQNQNSQQIEGLIAKMGTVANVSEQVKVAQQITALNEISYTCDATGEELGPRKNVFPIALDKDCVPVSLPLSEDKGNTKVGRAITGHFAMPFGEKLAEGMMKLASFKTIKDITEAVDAIG